VIGRVKADGKDGSLTLKIRRFLANRTCAIYASETGIRKQPVSLYSLTSEASGNLSNALIIQAK